MRIFTNKELYNMTTSKLFCHFESIDYDKLFKEFGNDDYYFLVSAVLDTRSPLPGYEDEYYLGDGESVDWVTYKLMGN